MITFRMCKYCGNRITGRGFLRNGQAATSIDGWYCSRSCAEACHGFDWRIAKERRKTTVSFSLAQHDRPCVNTRTPAEILMESEEGGTQSERDAAAANGQRADLAVAMMRVAARVDPRLPGMLLMLADGATQEQVAKRFKMAQSNVVRLIKELRATVSASEPSAA